VYGHQRMTTLMDKGWFPFFFHLLFPIYQENLPQSSDPLLPALPQPFVSSGSQSYEKKNSDRIANPEVGTFVSNQENHVRKSLMHTKKAHSIFRSPSVTTLMGICIGWPCYQPWPLATWMLAAAPSPRGSDADLSIAGYVVGGFHDESLPSRHAS
jgi:hypothetical protein